MRLSDWDRLPVALQHDIMVRACVFTRGAPAVESTYGVVWRDVSTTYPRLLEVFGEPDQTYCSLDWSVTFVDGRCAYITCLKSWAFDGRSCVPSWPTCEEWSAYGYDDEVLQRIKYLVRK
jgi:hypothetical protein